MLITSLQNPDLTQIYLDVMAEDGFDNGFEDMKNVDKRFSLIGDYRQMIAKPQDLKYHMIRYSDPNQNLTVQI
jgi:tRNA pseudouridine13 synthase